MIFLHLHAMADDLLRVGHVGILSIAAASISTLHGAILWFTRKGKYVEIQSTLIVLAFATFIYWTATICVMDIDAGTSYYRVFDSIVICFLVEWILIMRISTIKRLIIIAEKSGGGRWIA